VTNLHNTFKNCANIGGKVRVGTGVTFMNNCFANCTSENFKNIYVLSNKISGANGAFYNVANTTRHNIFIPNTGTTMTRFLYSNSYSIAARAITWTNDMTNNGCHYNTQYNLYIYPMDYVNLCDKYFNEECPSDYKKIATYTASNIYSPGFNTGFEYAYKIAQNGANFTIDVYSNKAPSHVFFENRRDLYGITYLNTTNLVTADYMFYNCTNLRKSLCDFNAIDLSNVKSADYMFYNCSKFNS
jgi:hypothetical protein